MTGAQHARHKALSTRPLSYHGTNKARSFRRYNCFTIYTCCYTTVHVTGFAKNTCIFTVVLRVRSLPVEVLLLAGEVDDDGSDVDDKYQIIALEVNSLPQKTSLPSS